MNEVPIHLKIVKARDNGIARTKLSNEDNIVVATKAVVDFKYTRPENRDYKNRKFVVAYVDRKMIQTMMKEELKNMRTKWK